MTTRVSPRQQVGRERDEVDGPGQEEDGPEADVRRETTAARFDVTEVYVTASTGSGDAATGRRAAVRRSAPSAPPATV